MCAYLRVFWFARARMLPDRHFADVLSPACGVSPTLEKRRRGPS
ncbi:hypothetical protein VPHK479_0056 [Vibrio phage K479]